MSRLLYKGGSSFCMGLIIFKPSTLPFGEELGISLCIFSPQNFIVRIPQDKLS